MISITNMMLLILTIILSAGRNMLSKNVARTAFGSKSFYRLQCYIFASGAVALVIFTKKYIPSSTTVLMALIYTLFLISAQWCYTMALSKIKVSICSTIYSLGFVIPTLSGSIFWNESFTLYDFFGMCCVITAIIVSGMNKKTTAKTQIVKWYFVALIIAMLSSGGLGLIQKIQQSMPHSDEKDAFVAIAFICAALVSFIFSLFAKSDKTVTNNKQFVYASLTGICFGTCNLLNTTLAGKLDSALFFPLQNISVILLSIVLSCVFTKEKITKQSIVVFLLGAISMVLLNI